MCIHIYIYIHIHTYIHRERERELYCHRAVVGVRPAAREGPLGLAEQREAHAHRAIEAPEGAVLLDLLEDGRRATELLDQEAGVLVRPPVPRLLLEAAPPHLIH